MTNEIDIDCSTSIKESVEEYLTTSNVAFEFLSYASELLPEEAAASLEIAEQAIVRAVMFKGHEGQCMAILPVNDILDVETLNEILCIDLDIISANSANEIFPDRESTVTMPFGTAYGVSVIVAKDLDQNKYIYVNLPESHCYLKITYNNFSKLQSEFRVINFSVCCENSEYLKANAETEFKRRRLEYLLKRIGGLPAMPQMAQRILQVTNNADSGADDLAKVIEVDPSLSAQIMSYGTSAFYGYRGDITSVQESIARVLGFDLVANLAMGIAIGKSFQIPVDGPLGIDKFWRHAVYSAALVERISKSLPREYQVNPGLAYLSGLLHNFGHLLLGHVFQPGFVLLSKYILANFGIPITQLERFSLGIEHGEIGSLLLKNWKMPAEVIVATRHHHDEFYQGEHEMYARLVLVADRLLWRKKIGDASTGKIPALIMDSFNMDSDKLEKVAEPLLNACVELDVLAKQFSK